MNDPMTLSASEAFEMATKHGAEAMRLNTGEIKEGKLADLLLLDLIQPNFTPNHNLISNIVYSANGFCVDTTICDGKILMLARKVKDEEIIMQKAICVAEDLIKRSENEG